MSAMTKSEIETAMKGWTTELRQLDAKESMYRGKVESEQAKVLELTAKLQMASGQGLRYVRDKLKHAKERLEEAEMRVLALLDWRVRAERELQELNEQYAKMPACRSSSDEANDEKEMRHEVSASVMVRLLSGEIKQVEIDMVRPVATFADEFASQHGYNPRATSQMVFLIESEDEEKENVLWSHEERHEGKTFADLFGEGDLPIVNLIINPMKEDNETREKVNLIRKLLKEQFLNANYDDETLYSMFGVWNLTYQPPAKSNRYLTMKTFVEQNGDAFWPLSEEEKEEMKDREMLQRFRNGVMEDAKFMVNACIVNPAWMAGRLHWLPHVERLVATGDYETLQSHHISIRNYITIYELVKMGVPTSVMCNCQYEKCAIKNYPYWMERAGPIEFPQPYPANLPNHEPIIVWRV